MEGGKINGGREGEGEWGSMDRGREGGGEWGSMDGGRGSMDGVYLHTALEIHLVQ